MHSCALGFHGKDDESTREIATMAFSYGDFSQDQPLHWFSTFSLVMEKSAMAEQQTGDGEGRGGGHASGHVGDLPSPHASEGGASLSSVLVFLPLAFELS